MLGFAKLKFQLVLWGLKRFCSEMASYASPVFFLGKKQVVAGQDLSPVSILSLAG